MSAEADLIYCYPGSDTLINLLDLRDPEQLKQAERTLSAARLIELYKKPLPGDFDLTHLQRIHHYIFQDIYAWAGELRRIEIAKGLFFCRSAYIVNQAQKLFAKLSAEHCLQRCPESELAGRAAYYLSEINAIHPFRDGNGRAQREFIREMLAKRGIKVDYSRTEPQRMTEASIASFGGDYSLMEALFKQCIVPAPKWLKCKRAATTADITEKSGTGCKP